jgi:diadenylate cyclase
LASVDKIISGAALSFLPFLNHSNLPRLTLTSAIDIIVVAFLIYQLLMILRGRRAFPILLGILFLTVVYLIAAEMHLELLRSILAALAPYTALALIVMFQADLRRMLSRIGRSRLFGLGGRMQRREMAQEIVLAVTELASQKIGALIVVERDIGLRTFIESGTSLDAYISRDLLCAIFYAGGPLHDGAVIIQRDRIAAAGCFLPLTMNPLLLSKLGTRHRAALGITEEADCIAIIVSEETGQLSVAAFGEIEFNVSPKRVEERLATHARRREPKPASDRAASTPQNPPHEVTPAQPLRRSKRL